MKIRSIRDVAESQMCCGCGACAYLQPNRIQMSDVASYGRRPVVSGHGESQNEQDALAVCPGIELSHTFDARSPGLNQELVSAWGPIYEIWEGHAADEEIRFSGSSGGAATALALFAVEQQGFHGVLHTGAREDVPYLNETVMSHTREDLLKRTGSRYAPASPCDGLQKIEDAPSPCLFIGKPCDVAAAQKARRLRPQLDQKLGISIAFFCAGTPSTKGTIEMLTKMGVTDLRQLVSVRYRGKGWPGKATAVYRNADGTESESQLTYSQSWGDILEKHRQWRCYLCVDHTGEFADIAVGDPWYRGVPDDAPGQSLILARTRRGQEFLAKAIEAGYLTAAPAEPWKLPASQRGFPVVRGKVWGRVAALRLLSIPAPRYIRMPMARFWWTQLSVMEKFKSIVGTIRRAWKKRLYRRVSLVSSITPSAIEPATTNSLERT